MKCVACGYYVDIEEVWYTPITFYKSGKKKGKIRRIDKERITTNKQDKREFKEIFVRMMGKPLEICIDDEDTAIEYLPEIQMWACPECDTVKIVK